MKLQRTIHYSFFALLLTLGVATIGWGSPAAADDSHALTKTELKQLIATAKTPADHRKLAAHYRQEAARFEETRTEHEQMLAAYEKNRQQYRNKFPSMADHCRALIKNATNSRDKSAEMAKMHEEMAATNPHAGHQH